MKIQTGVNWIQIRILFLALTALCASASVKAADINITDVYATVINAPNGLNVRRGPGTNYAAFGKARNNSTVKVTHSNGIWRKISWYTGENAYVHSAYLRIQGGSSSSCSGSNCAGRNPATSGCNATSVHVNGLGGHKGTGYRTNFDIRLSQNCKSAWVRKTNSLDTSDYVFIFTANNKHLLDTDNMYDGIRWGLVQVQGTPISKGTNWSNMVTRRYVRICVAPNGATPGKHGGRAIPTSLNCLNYRYIVRNPHVTN